MYLVEILLPVNTGQDSELASLRQLLTDRFGGLTAFSRAPAMGFWSDNDKHISRDDIVVVEVMTDHIDGDWWSSFRVDLEQRLRQKEIVIRWHAIGRL
jgi:hypothetical protein